MKRVVFLLEERSAEALLHELLPRVIPNLAFLCVPHEGKQDLEKSIPRKLRAWREPGVRFVVIRDNDGADCRELKERLSDLCRDAERDDTVIRIACQEIEAWYLGEPEALAEAFEREDLAGIASKARYREPDAIQHPSDELVKLVPEYQKVSGARRIGRCLSPERNRSSSFQALVAALRGLEP